MTRKMYKYKIATTYWDVARSIDLSSTTEGFSAYCTSDYVSYGKKIVTKSQKYYWSLGITKSGRFNPKRQ